MVDTQISALEARNRVSQALDRAEALAERSARLRAETAALRARSRRLRRFRQDSQAYMGFRVSGVVDNQRVTAEWSPTSLVGSGALLTRADLIVRLGDTFATEDGTVLEAALDAGPTRALLTLVRACDRVESIAVRVGPPSAA